MVAGVGALAVLGLVALGVVAFLAYSAGPDGSTFVNDVAVGDCVDVPAGDDWSYLDVVPCTGAHDLEAYAVFSLDPGSWPGVKATDVMAVGRCEEGFAGYVGMPYDASDLEYTYVAPDEQNWADGDRQVTCFGYDPERDRLDVSLRAAQR